MKQLKDINWNQVYYFHEVANSGSMTLAAQNLSISISAVSEQIKKLEERLQVALFQRLTRRLELTPAGWELYACTREMFATGMRFLDKLSHASIGGYAVRVGVQETISAAVALDFLYQYAEIFTPFGTVNPHRETCAEALWQRILSGELDWGISLEAPRQSRLECQEIGSFEVAFCCSHEIFDRFEVKEEIIRHLPLARSISDKSLNLVISSHLNRLGIAPEEIIESDFREYCLGLAYRGRCIAPIAVKAIDYSPWKDRVRTFTVGGPITLRFFAIWAKSNERMVAIKKLRLLLQGDQMPSAIDSNFELDSFFTELPAN